MQKVGTKTSVRRTSVCTERGGSLVVGAMGVEVGFGDRCGKDMGVGGQGSRQVWERVEQTGWCRRVKNGVWGGYGCGRSGLETSVVTSV